MKVKSSFAKKVINNFEEYCGGQTTTPKYIYVASIYASIYSSNSNDRKIYEIRRFPNIPANSKYLISGEEFVGVYTSDGKWISA